MFMDNYFFVTRDDKVTCELSSVCPSLRLGLSLDFSIVFSDILHKVTY